MTITGKIKIAKIEHECFKKADKSVRRCFHPDCSNLSINSHILQKNGILSQIASDGHLWTHEVDYFDFNSFKFKRKGLDRVFSFNCFCKEHDYEFVLTP